MKKSSLSDLLRSIETYKARELMANYKNTLIGLNYVLLNIPFVWWGKMGFSSTLSGVKKRAKSVSDDMPGWALPIMAVILPMPWYFEQFMLWLLEGARARYYKGDGHTEALWFPGVIVAWVIQYSINLFYLEILHQAGISPVGAVWAIKWTLKIFKYILL